MARSFPNRGRLDTVSLESSLNGRTTKSQTHVLKCAAKSRVSPGSIVTSHGDDLLDRVTRRTSTAGAATYPRPVVLGGELLPVPTQDRFGCSERRDLGQSCAPERPAFFREKTALGVRESQTLGPDVRPENTILGAQVLDGLALSPTHPARDQQDQKLERSLQRH